MKPLFCLLISLIINNILLAQDTAVRLTSKEFFAQETLPDVTITTDLGTMVNNKDKEKDKPGSCSITMPDGSIFSGDVLLRVRGKFRLEHCYVPPLRVNFKNEKSPRLSSLKSLKLVNGCSMGSYNDQLLLKEYLVYKIYNLLTDMSFRVRLVNLKVEDSKKKKKTIDIHSFFLEDMDDLAKRNDCRKWADSQHINTEGTNRAHMTFVSIFEYMIGNTDWAVPVGHNIKLMSLKKESVSRPYVVPYDFDYSGIVNANYAIPDERLGTTTVRERVYRGFPRNVEEIKIACEPFREQKEKIYSLIKNFDLLSNENRSDMLGYLDEFYKSIKTDNDLKRLFLDNARHE